MKAVQIYGRLIHCYWQPRVKLSSSPKLSKHNDSWQEPACRLPSMTGPYDFKFLNEEGNLNEVGWGGAMKDKLWRYNQHYFDDLNAQNADQRRSWHKHIIEKWIVENPPCEGTGWDPYPTSLRIVNWIKWHLRCDKLNNSALQSLFIQLRWLNRRLEYHLLGNHLFANAKALVYGGLFFSNTEAKKWLQQGLQILEREVKEQILPDGGHFELSTMYHALILEDILDLINITKTFEDKLTSEQKNKISVFPDLAKTMHQWLRNMCHPDGEISFFNDSAFDIASSVEEIDAYLKRLEIESSLSSKNRIIMLEDSGYARITNGPALALIDVAKIGPDYLPGHAHADTLSFEFSFENQRVIVNSGTSCYGSSNKRLEQRATSSHNTVAIDNENSSEVWSGFRVGRKACPQGLKFLEKNNGKEILLECSHDGYERLKGKPVHHRTWLMSSDSLIITDKITGKYDNAEARYYFHPEVKIDFSENLNECELVLTKNKSIKFEILNGVMKVVDSFWYPKFGCQQTNKSIIIKPIQKKIEIRLRWSEI